MRTIYNLSACLFAVLLCACSTDPYLYAQGPVGDTEVVWGDRYGKEQPAETALCLELAKSQTKPNERYASEFDKCMSAKGLRPLRMKLSSPTKDAPIKSFDPAVNSQMNQLLKK